MSSSVKPTFEILQFCMARKASKKRSLKTEKTNKKTKTTQSFLKTDNDDFQRVFMDNHASSGFFNHSIDFFKKNR